jgi:hypothetical protein
MKRGKRLTAEELEFSRLVETLTASIWETLQEYDAQVISCVTARLLAHFLSGWTHKTDTSRLREEVLEEQLRLVHQILALGDRVAARGVH